MEKNRNLNFKKLVPQDYRASSSKSSQVLSLCKKIWFLTFFVFALIIAAQLVASNLLAGKGEQLAILEKKASQLVRENLTLQEELAHKSSLTKLSVQAQNEGFTKPEQILYLDTSFPVASLEQ